MPIHKTVLSIMAHPDDAEFTCAGTLTLLKERGWEIHIATMTPGDCGTATRSREEISMIRRREGFASAMLLEGDYHCLEEADAFIMYDKPTLQKVVGLLRRVRPSLVFAPSPNDYFIDHENTAQLARTACFCCGIPNVEADTMEPFPHVPHLYYADPLGGVDLFGEPVTPGIYVEITQAFEHKKKMLCCHESQRSWLMDHHGMDEYVLAMKRHAEMRGEEVGVAVAEGFRQHRGHAYPQDDLLAAELPDQTHAPTE